MQKKQSLLSLSPSKCLSTLQCFFALTAFQIIFFPLNIRHFSQALFTSTGHLCKPLLLSLIMFALNSAHSLSNSSLQLHWHCSTLHTPSLTLFNSAHSLSDTSLQLHWHCSTLHTPSLTLLYNCTDTVQHCTLPVWHFSTTALTLFNSANSLSDTFLTICSWLNLKPAFHANSQQCIKSLNYVCLRTRIICPSLVSLLFFM